MKQSFKLFTFKGAPVELSIWFFLIFLIAPVSWSIAILISVLVHELAHAYIANKRGWKVFGIKLDLFSGSASIDSNIPERDSIPVVAAGPISNLLLAFITLSIYIPLYSVNPILDRFLNDLFTVNIILFIFNILPIYPMDGGRILKDVLFLKMKNRKLAKKISGSVSLIFSIALLTLSLITLSYIIIIFSILFIYLSLKELEIIKD
jgi:Zn-dependent protease